MGLKIHSAAGSWVCFLGGGVEERNLSEEAGIKAANVTNAVSLTPTGIGMMIDWLKPSARSGIEKAH